MSTAPQLLLTPTQASSLQIYLQNYRRYTFASLAPSTTRNTTLRVLQAIQGKLITMIDQKATLVQLILTQEERATLKEVVSELLLLYAQTPESIERNAALIDLASLKNSLKDA